MTAPKTIEHFTATIFHHYGKQQNLSTEQGDSLALIADQRGHIAAKMAAVDSVMGNYCDRLASGEHYEVWGITNAIDEECQPNPYAAATLNRLTGWDWTGDNTAYGPILIIEA